MDIDRGVLAAIFEQALDRPPEERSAFLDKVCPHNPSLRAELDALLVHYKEAPAFFEDLSAMVPAVPREDPPGESPADPYSLTGTQVSHYQILDKLGGGGMGVVYKAHDTKLGRIVALKFLPPYLSADVKAKARFILEARAASALDHPNICTIYEIGETAAGRLFIAMACYDGQTLKKKINRGAVPVEEALDYAIQMARGLAKAHVQGMIHRDIKPANVMVTDDGVVKILDFGLAKTADVQLTRTGAMMGTIAYMSPEQACGDEVDQRTDIWALGVVLFEMLTGERPFGGDYDQAVIYAILNQEPPRLSALNDDLPPDLEHVVAMCLEKDRAVRYPTMADLLADLDVIVQGAGHQALSIQTLTTSRLSRMRQHHTQPAEDITIVVLPFADMSPDRDQEYFCDGMAEELSDALAKVDRWRVVARTSAFSFKGKDLDIRQIGEQLKASHILEGSIRKAGNRLRIRVELVDVDDGFQLWSEKYNRELDDVFAIQEDIAHSIVANLKMELTTTQGGSLVRRHTDDLEAYSLYLKARFHLNKRTEAGLRKGRAYCQQTLDRDPHYAPAYAGLADCLLLLGFHGAYSPGEVMPQAKAAAERALELDNSLAEAYTSLGCIRSVYEWDWPGAEGAFQRALGLNPNHATAHHWYAIWYLLPMGRFDEALASLENALALDPISLILNAGVGWCHYFARRYDEAIEALQKTLEMEESFVMAHDLLGQVYVQQNRYDEAIAEMLKAVTLSERRTLSLATLGHLYALAGKRDEARMGLDELKQRARHTYVSSYDIALIYAGLDEHDRTFEWLDKAYEERSGWLGFLNVEPRFDTVRSDPRFPSLLKRVRLES